MRVPPRRLYLDTARLGLMCQGAQRALNDFAKLLSEEGLSLYATRWLVHGDERASANSRQADDGEQGFAVSSGGPIEGTPLGISIEQQNAARFAGQCGGNVNGQRCLADPPFLIEYRDDFGHALLRTIVVFAILRFLQRVLRNGLASQPNCDRPAAFPDSQARRANERIVAKP